MAWVLVENTKVSVLFYVVIIILFETGQWHEAKLHYMLYDTTLLGFKKEKTKVAF